MSGGIGNVGTVAVRPLPVAGQVALVPVGLEVAVLVRPYVQEAAVVPVPSLKAAANLDPADAGVTGRQADEEARLAPHAAACHTTASNILVRVPVLVLAGVSATAGVEVVVLVAFPEIGVPCKPDVAEAG